MRPYNKSTNGTEPLDYLNIYEPFEFSGFGQIILIVLYSISTFLTVSGNITVIVVLLFGRKSKTDLTKFLINLALANLLMAFFCIPYTFTETMLGYWIFGRLMCPLVHCMQLLSVGVSIFTNVAVGIDRYWAVGYPLRKRLTKSKAKVVIGIIWASSAALAAPGLYASQIRPLPWLGEGKEGCDELWSDKERKIFTLFLLCFTYVIPVCLLMFTYFRIGRILYQRSQPDIRTHVQTKSTRKVIKMLFIVVTAFVLSWLPLHTFTLLHDFVPSLYDRMTEEEDNELIYYTSFYACHWLAMSNSFANPIIYGFMNESFRGDLRSLWNRICSTCYKKNHHQYSNQYGMSPVAL